FKFSTLDQSHQKENSQNNNTTLYPFSITKKSQFTNTNEHAEISNNLFLPQRTRKTQKGGNLF
ncbi:MAG: hypothetical protein LBK06_02370, partial [Planctomycetaceae bacterium]|nr:hypothetical protein [Planctomycetaceae bacterium]